MSSHNPTWADCRQLLMTLFSREERTRIQEAAVKLLKARVPSGETESTWVAARCPETDPKWDYSKQDQLDRLKEYQQLLIDAMRAGMKKPVNLSRPREVIQGADETPDHFYERLLDAYQRYTPLEINDPANQRTINMAFVSQSWPDIKKKLQKQEGFEGMPISYLMELARKTFNNRDEVEKTEKIQHAKRKAQFLAAALTEVAPQNRQGAPRRAAPGECFNCREVGHRIADCPYPRRGPSPRYRAHFQGQQGPPQQYQRAHYQGQREPQPQRQRGPNGQVQQGIYKSDTRSAQPLNPNAPSYAPQEVVGVAEMDYWDNSE